jgi:hypothetical protein
VKSSVLSQPGSLTAGIEPAEKVMDRLSFRKDHTWIQKVGDPASLNIHWEDQGNQHSQSGYYAKVDGEELRLTTGAINTACQMIKAKPSFFFGSGQFQDRNAFPTTLCHILRGRKDSSVKLAHNGLEVTAILPVVHEIRSAYDMLTDFLDEVSKCGELKGIQAIEQGNGDIGSYRIVMGNNLIPSMQSKFGQYMSFLLEMSETGQIPTKTTISLFRTICTNSGIRGTTDVTWDHRSPSGRFYDRTMETIRHLGYFGEQYGKVFGEMANTPLGMPAEDLLHGMKHEKLITNAHFEAAVIQLATGTEDGRQVETHYDMYNALTRAAQDMPSLTARSRAEAKSLEIMTAPGGVREKLREAASRN